VFIPRLLLCRSPLYPGESLPSYLERLAARNRYDPPGLLKEVCLEGLQDHWSSPNLEATYQRLAALTGIGRDELYGAAPHRFTAPLVPPDAQPDTLPWTEENMVPLLPKRIATRHLRPVSAAQYCPACLREAAYHRLLWLPIAAAACPRHQNLLVTECPGCGETVSVRAVVQVHCNHCGADLRAALPTSIADDEHGLFAQRIIQDWLSSAAPPFPDLPPPLAALSPNVLFRVLDGLRWAVESAMQADPAWDYVHPVPANGAGHRPTLKRTRLTPAESYRVYATAFKALLNWPEGFYEFMRAYNLQERQRNSQTPEADATALYPQHADRRGLYADLGAFYSQWIQRRWQQPAFAFIQEAFDQYVVATYTGSVAIIHSQRYLADPTYADKFPCASYAEAARILGVTELAIARLEDWGRLAQYETPTGKQLNTFVRRQELLELRERWRETVMLEEAARLLGVNRHLVVRMAQVGALAAERGPGIDGSTRWLFSRQAVDECLHDISRSVHRSCPELPSLELSLADAARAVAVVGLGAADLLKRVREGRLEAYSPAPVWPVTIPVLGELRIDRIGIDLLLEEIKTAEGWIGREDIARWMGVKHTVVTKWVRAGLLTPTTTCGPAWHFDRAEVRRFVADHVFTEQTAEILRVSKGTVLRWARLGRLVPVAGPQQGCHRYLFRREDVERLRRETRLTAPELAERLGISKAQVLRRVRKGQLQPVSGPGIDGYKHFLFEVPPGGLVIPGRPATTKRDETMPG